MTNRLADSTSPYLLQHAHNPVDWYPWGPEALARAASEDKPIFLSIGYASCHWCHVMAHESFEDPDTADLMNEHFICVKVDREERPDLDSIYMDAVVAMTGQGGWPMSVFLTPRGEPFFGGTYFPPLQMHGMPAFKQVLSSVAKAWESDRQRLVTAGSELTERIAEPLTLSERPTELSPSMLEGAAGKLLHSYDWSHGGWGAAPKFPQPTVIEFLLQRAAVSQDKLARDMAAHALRSMASGGIFDHIGGGFARYAVDAQWTVPHFEKMLYDNAQLISAYLHGWQVTQDAELLEVAQRTVAFCLRELRLPEGGFASSLDADSEGKEGSFYVWDRKELEEVVAEPEHWRFFAAAYGLSDPPNFEGRYVLRRQISDADLAREMSVSPEKLKSVLAESRERVFEARSRRVRPALDDKVLAAWNGMLLQALAHFARSTGDIHAADASLQLARFLRDRMLDGDRPSRAWRAGETSQLGFLEDSAALGLGWLAQYELDFEPEWFALARAQADVVLDHFVDPNGGFFDTPDDQADQLVARPKSLQDSPTPSGNTLAIQLLLQVAALTGESRQYASPAIESLGAMQERAARHPTAFAGWLSAIGFALGPQSQIAFIGFEPKPDFDRLRSTVDTQYLPLTVLAGRDKPSDEDPALLDGRARIQGRPTAYVCREFTCKKPTADPIELANQLRENSRP